MNDDAERIARRMMAIRQDLGDGVQDIVHGAQHMTDWRYYVRRHPWACVAGTMALGFLAAPALRVTRRSPPGFGRNVAGGRCAAAEPVAAPGLLLRAVQLAAPLAARGVATFVARRLTASEPSPVAATEDHG